MNKVDRDGGHLLVGEHDFSQVKLVMTFDQFNKFMLLLSPVLPALGLPIYLLFVLAGKGTSRIAVFLSLSVPGLFILGYDMWSSGSDGCQIYPVSSVLMFFCFLTQVLWCFPSFSFFRL
jgi:hypothetical protein